MVGRQWPPQEPDDAMWRGVKNVERIGARAVAWWERGHYVADEATLVNVRELLDARVGEHEAQVQRERKATSAKSTAGAPESSPPASQLSEPASSQLVSGPVKGKRLRIEPGYTC